MKTVGEIIDKFIDELIENRIVTHNLKMVISKLEWDGGMQYVTIEAGVHR